MTRVAILLILVLAPCSLCHGEFADAKLEAAVREALDVAQGAPLTPKALAGLTELRAARRGITQLDGLEACTGLRSIDLSRNPVADLAPLATLEALEVLLIQNTQVVRLDPLSGLTSLRELYLDGNRVASLSPVAGCVSLETLSANRNPIESLAPLAGLEKLSELGVAQAAVRDLPALHRLRALRRVDLSGNALNDPGALGALTGLIHLGLANTGLREAGFLAGLTRLEDLDLAGNGIGDLEPLAALSALRRLNLRGNPLRDCAPLTGLTQLAALSLAQSYVSDAGPLTSLEALSELNLTETPLNQASLCDIIPALLDKGVKVSITGACGADGDGDGLADAYETGAGTDPAAPDSDGDGLSDGQEITAAGTNPLVEDSDADGVPDGEEVAFGRDPLLDDNAADLDGDGVDNATERAHGTAPNKPADRPAAPRLEVSPESLALDEEADTAVFEVKNGGDLPLRWTVESASPRVWVTNAPDGGSPGWIFGDPSRYDRVTEGRGPRALAVRADDYTADLGTTITLRNAENPDEAVVMRVHLAQGAPKAPDEGYALTVTVVPEGAGEIFLDPAGGRYTAGAEVRLGATAREGYVFTGWQGDVADPGAAATTIVVAADTAVVALFEAEASGGLGCRGAGAARPGAAKIIWVLGLMVLLALAYSSWRMSASTPRK